MHERLRPRAPAWAMFVLLIVLVALYLPVFIMMVSSFIISKRDSLVGIAWGVDWYRAIFADEELLRALSRSFIVGLVASGLATIIGGLASIAIFRSTFRMSDLLNKFSFLTLVIPELVFALSLLSWFFIMHVQLSLFTVIVAHVTFSLSFVMMTMNGRMATLDPSLEDAGRDLGASEWLILKKIIIPILLPAFMSGFLLSFLLSFDDFLITFFTIGIGTDTLPIKLYSSMKSGLTPKLSALATLMFLISVTIISLLIKIRGAKILRAEG